jgi:hypothetical protein
MVWVFIACQAFVVLFIALHDWMPLGRFNNVKGVRSADPIGKLAVTTFVSALPFAVALGGTIYYAAGPFPIWLSWLLWISYGVAVYGVLRTWYVPYLLVNEPDRARRYKLMHGGTSTFLPERNGFAPNALHVVFHAVLLATVVFVVYLTVTGVLSS